MLSKNISQNGQLQSFAGFLVAAICCLLASCNKLVQVPEPLTTVTATETFGSDANATAAVMAIYSDMSWGQSTLRYGNGGITVYAGLASDELNSYTGNPESTQFQTNTVLSNNSVPGGIFWTPEFFDIYMANSAIQNLQVSTGVTPSVQTQLIGESKFLRALCYFYLVNLFGDVPLNLTADWTETNLLSRTPAAKIYQQITNDLLDAQSRLVSDYSLSDGQRIRANKWAATGLLARVYLYRQLWDSAEMEANLVIGNSSTFSLVQNLNNVFLANSQEAILQLETADIYPYSTQEGQQFITPDSTSSPNYYLTTQLLGAFETNDARRVAWVDSTDYSGYFWYPSKYKVLIGAQGNETEFYTVLRLAEQYLIRAEARANESSPNLPGAIGDLNTIRERATLADLPMTLTAAQVISAIAQERRIELFAEWGHRWFDLKRTTQATSVLGAISTKQPWSPNQLLFPIPISEIQADPNLSQNLGY